MLTLHIYRNGDRLQSMRFDKNVIKLGRSAPADIIFHDPTISKTHCVLTKKPNYWLLEDCSKNGMMLPSGQPIVDRTQIESHKRYHLGRSYAIEVELEDTSTSKEATVVVAQKPTQLLKVDEQKSQITLGTAILSVTLSDGRVIQKTIDQPSTTIGSHESNDFVIPTDSVSLFHARVDFLNHNYIYTDLGSTNGSKIDDLKIERATLPPNCEIDLGSLKLQFLTKEEKLQVAPKDCTQFSGMVGKSKAMQRIFSMIEIIANTDAPALITGETGTGKELVARAIHELSKRFNKPFIAINCAALPKDMIESELFGHEKGAFTGAIAERHGAFEAANHGTLFLDEIGELDADLQAKLLRVLESGEVKRVGSNKITKVSVRIVTATHRDLIQDVQYGRFRQDLLYRLHVAPIHIPALRERREDLDVLVPHLLKRLEIDAVIAPDAFEALRYYEFAGNIRELKNILQRAVIEHEVQGGKVTAGKPRVFEVKHFQFIKGMPILRGPKNAEEQREYEKIIKALEQAQGKQTEAAKILQLPLSTFNDRVRKYGLNSRR